MSVPARTTADRVQAILGSGSPVSNWDGQTDLTPYIETASAMVDQVIAFNLARGLGGAVPISATVAELIERWLSAYYYVQMDPIYQSKNTQSASAQFTTGGQTLDGEGDRYKRAAIGIDPSGVLNSLLNRKVAGGAWLGSYYPSPPWGA